MRARRPAVFFLPGLSLLGGLLTGRPLLFNLAYLFGILLLISFAWAWANINWVHISRVTRVRRTQVGRPLEERFTVRNTSIFPKLWLELHDYSSVPGHFASQVVHNLGPRSQESWRVTTICRERGRYQLGPITLNSSDPFGFFPMTRELDPTTNVVVYPMTVDVHQFALPVGMLPGGDALRRRTHYVTTNAFGVRDYAPGDSFGRIHWPSTARRDRLVVKEFELDPMADIWLIPDMSVFGHFDASPEIVRSTQRDNVGAWITAATEEMQLKESTEEYTVTVAASLAQFFLRRDRAVGMLAYGQARETVQPDRGERQLNRLLEVLAVIRADGQAPIHDVLHAEAHMLPRGATVIVITPTFHEGWATVARQLKRRGLRVVTVLIDPESFGGKRSNAGLYQLLQASGIVTYFVRCGDDLTATLSTGYSRAQHFAVA